MDDNLKDKDFLKMANTELEKVEVAASRLNIRYLSTDCKQ